MYSQNKTLLYRTDIRNIDYMSESSDLSEEKGLLDPTVYVSCTDHNQYFATLL